VAAAAAALQPEMTSLWPKNSPIDKICCKLKQPNKPKYNEATGTLFSGHLVRPKQVKSKTPEYLTYDLNPSK
jgi:hypothetical protein